MKNLFFSLFVFFPMVAIAADVKEGEAIFKTRCTACHSMESPLVGPALKGANERYDLDWFTKFVTSSTAMIASGDKKAIEVFERFNKIPMLDHKDLTSEQIASIYEYIKENSGGANAASDDAAKIAANKMKQQPILKGENTWMIYAWIGLTILLVVGLLAIVKKNDKKDK